MDLGGMESMDVHAWISRKCHGSYGGIYWRDFMIKIGPFCVSSVAADIIRDLIH